MEARDYIQYRFDVSSGHVAYLDTQGYVGHGVYNNPIYNGCFSYVNAYECFAHNDALCRYCAVVIPTDIDEVLLYKHRLAIAEYLNKGGIVLSFAQVFLPWLPGNSLCKSDVGGKHEICTCPHPLTSGVRDYDLNYILGVKIELNRAYFIAPPKSMCFLNDNYGRCMGYIDEHTTNGVIVATCGVDLLNFFVYEFSTSRRLGLNLLKWLEEYLAKRVA